MPTTRTMLRGCVCGLRNERTLKLEVLLPRLATFFYWASVCRLQRCRRRGEFRAHSPPNAKDATEDVIEGDQVGLGIPHFVAERESGKGSRHSCWSERGWLCPAARQGSRTAHAQAAKDKDDIAKESTRNATRGARDGARYLRDGWLKAPNASPASSSAPSPRCATQASVSIGLPDTADEKIIRITTSAPKSRRKNRPHRPRLHPEHMLSGYLQNRDDPGRREDDVARVEDVTGRTVPFKAGRWRDGRRRTLNRPSIPH